MSYKASSQLASPHNARQVLFKSTPEKRSNSHNTSCFKGHTDGSLAVTAIHKSLTGVALMNEERGVKDGGKYRENKHFAERITNVAQGQGDKAKNQTSGSLSVRVRRDDPHHEA